MFEDIADTTLLAFDKDLIEDRQRRNKEFFLTESGLSFMDDHFGPRPGCIHTLLGSTGKGKSTLVQSLILKWAIKDKVLLYLSEESTDRVELKFFEKSENASYLSSKLHVTHERDILKNINYNDYKSLLICIEEKIKSSEAKILVFDNLTTSQFYENRLQNANGLLAGLRDLADKYHIPVFLICHTKKGINETTKGMMLPDDVRGSSGLANTSDYFYTFYRLRITNEFGSTKESCFIYVNKCRDHETQDSIYRLEYNVYKKCYISDTAVNFKVFKDSIKERDRA